MKLSERLLRHAEWWMERHVFNSEYFGSDEFIEAVDYMWEFVEYAKEGDNSVLSYMCLFEREIVLEEEQDGKTEEEDQVEAK